MSDDLSLEKGEALFRQEPFFIKGVVALEGLPPDDRAEIAFAGRSNVGKSSLINALFNMKSLARSSSEPGRTREINFFGLEDQLYIVDLPGYGFAKVPKKIVQAWTRLTLNYLQGRPNLKRVFLLIDARRGIGQVDIEIMDILEKSAVIYQVILTKTDKLKQSELTELEDKARTKIGKRAAAFPRILLTSSKKTSGIDILKAEIASLV